MTNLTVREKEHWKDQIERRIDKAIGKLLRQNEPGLLDRIERLAKEQARESMGLSDLWEISNHISEQVSALRKEQTNLKNQMYAIVTGCSPDEVAELEDSYYGRCVDSKVDVAVNARAKVIEQELLAIDPLGQQVLALRQEKEELLDTVWLATSGRQMKELWQHLTNQLNEQPTKLQADAINIAPLKEPAE